MSPFLVLVGSYPPPHGGQSVHIKKLTEHLQAHGHLSVCLNTGANKAIQEARVVNVRSSTQLLRALLRQSPQLVHLHVSTPDEFGKLVPVWLASIVRSFA